MEYLFEPETKVEDDGENDKIAPNINVMSNIFINLMCFAIGIPIFVLGIQLIDEDIITAIIFTIIGGGLTIFRIVKISELINNKFSKRL